VLDESPILSITVDTSNQDVTLRIDGELDAFTADTVCSALEAFDETAIDRVVVDLEHVNFIDSSGLFALLQGRDRLAQRNIPLLVRNPQPQARRLFDLALNGDQFEQARSA
jgi:stage II sporulation protein AA (anti-sigma F factor antagonist)